MPVVGLYSPFLGLPYFLCRVLKSFCSILALSRHVCYNAGRQPGDPQRPASVLSLFPFIFLVLDFIN